MTVSSYAERVLGQSYTKLPGNLIAGEVKVCAKADAHSAVRVDPHDFVLVLPGGQRVAGTTEAIPTLPKRSVAAGTCVQGTVTWDAEADQHPKVVYTQTGATWAPKCPSSTAGGVPCVDGIGPK